MRRNVRIQPYVSREVRERVRAHTTAHRLSESAVVDEALTEYLEREAPEPGLIAGRLDALAAKVDRLQEEVNALGHIVFAFTKVWFVTPVPATDEVAIAHGEANHAKLLRKAARRWAGKTLAEELKLLAASVVAVAANTNTRKGGRDE
jgi:hypothetical protein